MRGAEGNETAWLVERHNALGKSLAVSFGTLKGVQYLLRQNMDAAAPTRLDGTDLANMLELVVDSLEQLKIENEIIVADLMDDAGPASR